MRHDEELQLHDSHNILINSLCSRRQSAASVMTERLSATLQPAEHQSVPPDMTAFTLNATTQQKTCVYFWLSFITSDFVSKMGADSSYWSHLVVFALLLPPVGLTLGIKNKYLDYYMYSMYYMYYIYHMLNMYVGRFFILFLCAYRMFICKCANIWLHSFCLLYQTMAHYLGERF